MDFDIGNILYVLITLVAIIAGLLGKKKKPANQSPKETENESRPGFMENIERILRMGQENPQVTELQDYEEEIAYEEAIATRDDIIMATGRSDFPNQINNVLGFPFICF